MIFYDGSEGLSRSHKPPALPRWELAGFIHELRGPSPATEQKGSTHDG
jgi:hypothetical protein